MTIYVNESNGYKYITFSNQIVFILHPKLIYLLKIYPCRVFLNFCFVLKKHEKFNFYSNVMTFIGNAFKGILRKIYLLNIVRSVNEMANIMVEQTRFSVNAEILLVI